MSSRKTPMRLPPLKILRVRNPDRPQQNPCVAIMSSMLACWASAGHNTGTCLAVEQALRACTDGPKPPVGRKNDINRHLARMKKYITSPAKRK